MESRGPEDSKNVKTSQAYFVEGFISFFEDFSLTNALYYGSHGINRKNRVLYPGPGFLSNVTWPSPPKKRISAN